VRWPAHPVPAPAAGGRARGARPHRWCRVAAPAAPARPAEPGTWTASKAPCPMIEASSTSGLARSSGVRLGGHDRGELCATAAGTAAMCFSISGLSVTLVPALRAIPAACTRIRDGVVLRHVEVAQLEERRVRASHRASRRARSVPSGRAPGPPPGRAATGPEPAPAPPSSRAPVADSMIDLHQVPTGHRRPAGAEGPRATGRCGLLRAQAVDLSTGRIRPPASRSLQPLGVGGGRRPPISSVVEGPDGSGGMSCAWRELSTSGSGHPQVRSAPPRRSRPLIPSNA
jgi:hypothetical protein